MSVSRVRNPFLDGQEQVNKKCNKDILFLNRQILNNMLITLFLSLIERHKFIWSMIFFRFFYDLYNKYFKNTD